MLRIHFTNEDLIRVRVAGAPDPMWEILLSVHLLSRRYGAATFGPWRERTLAQPVPGMGMLLNLAPPWGYSPDFLTPAAGTGGLAAGIDAVLSTPRQRLRTDLELLSNWRRPSALTRSLAEGDPPTLRRLGDALHGYHQHTLAPYWRHIHASVDADRARRGRAVLDGGIDQLLNTLHPAIRWEPPVLQITLRTERDLYLEGRGLLLLPSFFCWRDPITLQDADLPPVLVYPIEHDLGWAGTAAYTASSGLRGSSGRNGATRLGSPPGSGAAIALGGAAGAVGITGTTGLSGLAGPAPFGGSDAGRRDAPAPRSLAALLGRTRAAALRTIDSGCTTSGLARRLGVSPASASEHATVLREAGLIISRRDRNAVYHTLTPLGHDLLSAGRQD